jgi:zinc and cadmium transporter
MANYLHVVFFSLVGGLFSLIGGILLLSHKSTAEVLAKFATPFAAGALLAAAFFELLPEAIGIEANASTAMRWTLAGIVAFFLLEHFLQWFHHHHEHADKNHRATAPLIVIGDTLHNFLDGIIIGAAFLISVPAGIVAALAVAAHEIPQEIGDFGLLLSKGLTRRSVLTINVLSALAATLGAILTFWLGSQSVLPVGAMLATAAGMFIYIAASDLIPTIHESFHKKHNYTAVGLLLTGIFVVGLATNLAHTYLASDDHGHSEIHIEDEAQDDHDRQELNHHDGN